MKTAINTYVRRLVIFKTTIWLKSENSDNKRRNDICTIAMPQNKNKWSK